MIVQRSKRGFTFIELLVVMGMLTILGGIATINLYKVQNNTTLATSINTLLSDISQQQLKAMQGDAEGRAAGSSYGVHFDTNRYVLFHGSTYNANDQSNLPIYLDSSINFVSVTVPSGNVIFNQISGEMSGYSTTANTITIKNISTTQQKVITVNRYGIVTQIN